MTRLVAAIAVLATLGARAGWAQSADECVPSALNIAEAKYPCLYRDHRALFRVVAPDAHLLPFTTMVCRRHPLSLKMPQTRIHAYRRPARGRSPCILW